MRISENYVCRDLKATINSILLNCKTTSYKKKFSHLKFGWVKSELYSPSEYHDA